MRGIDEAVSPRTSQMACGAMAPRLREHTDTSIAGACEESEVLVTAALRGRDACDVRRVLPGARVSYCDERRATKAVDPTRYESMG